MKIIPTKTPLVVKKMFPNYVWDISTTDKIIYLTFDDGPTPDITNWTLNLLKHYHAKATFFCIGHNIDKYPDVYNTIIAEQHLIGNHTYNHLKGWKTSVNDYVENVLKTETLIAPKTELKLFRPPYGKLKTKQAQQLQQLGYRIIMWDILSFDWDCKITPEDCLKGVIKNTKPGSIIVFHDSVKAERNLKYTLPKMLEHFSKKGYIFKSLPA